MLQESRTVIEPWCAYLAAQRRTDADVETLSRIDDESDSAMSAGGDFLDCKLRWHSALVAATHNDVLATFVDALSQSIARQSDADYLTGDDDAMRRSVAEHRLVTDAIRRRDSSVAHRLMSKHVRAPEVSS
ncbi:FadR family transcriptional regulator [Rhodococcus fascians]|nr:FadR family transcriptional regulator [Rhodococcus fascians]MBY4237975.1 FadR family transcriptional regulator [Rhodococcus fascians]MBY4253274.1 FadR family transcriptional regulator [Rhodococcus fascians]MBY4268911.1 FadR family transcriptional regulator [Rhodococcus fascians]